MDAYSPYAGTLVIPDQLVAGDSPVHLAEGEVVLKIRRPMLPIRGAFELLDPDGEPLAYGRAKGFVRPRYPLEAPDGTTLLELVLGLKGASGASTVTLPDGRRLSAQGTWWTLRRFSVHDGEAEVAEDGTWISKTGSMPNTWGIDPNDEDRLDVDAWMQLGECQFAGRRIRCQHAQIGDHSHRSAPPETTFFPFMSTAAMSVGRHEVESIDEAAPGVRQHDHDLFTVVRDRGCSTRAG